MLSDEITKQLPDLRGLLDGRAEQKIFIAFMKVYEYMETKTSNLQAELNKKISEQTASITKQSDLLNGFGTQLIGIQSAQSPLATLGSGNINSFTITAGTNLTGGGTINSDGATLSLNVSANPSVTTITVNGLRCKGKTSSAADPSITELPTNGDWCIHRNTVSTLIYLAYNNSGTIVKVQLT